MKNKLWFACLLLVFAFKTQAQTTRTTSQGIKIGFGGGVAIPHNNLWKRAGALTYVEPTYDLTDVVTVGLRAEWLILAKFGLDDGRSYEQIFRGSYMLTGKYYLGTGKTRVFVGAGLGLCALSPVRYNKPGERNPNLFSGGTSLTAAEKKVGFCPRIGIDLFDRISLSVDYNFIPSSSVIEPGNTARVSNSYLGLHLGALCFVKKQN